MKVGQSRSRSPPIAARGIAVRLDKPRIASTLYLDGVEHKIGDGDRWRCGGLFARCASGHRTPRPAFGYVGTSFPLGVPGTGLVPRPNSCSSQRTRGPVYQMPPGWRNLEGEAANPVWHLWALTRPPPVVQADTPHSTPGRSGGGSSASDRPQHLARIRKITESLSPIRPSTPSAAPATPAPDTDPSNTPGAASPARTPPHTTRTPQGQAPASAPHPADQPRRPARSRSGSGCRRAPMRPARHAPPCPRASASTSRSMTPLLPS